MVSILLPFSLSSFFFFFFYCFSIECRKKITFTFPCKMWAFIWCGTTFPNGIYNWKFNFTFLVPFELRDGEEESGDSEIIWRRFKLNIRKSCKVCRDFSHTLRVRSISYGRLWMWRYEQKAIKLCFKLFKSVAYFVSMSFSEELAWKLIAWKWKPQNLN